MLDPVTSEHKMHGCMLDADELEYYADLIAKKGCPLADIVGFIDGTTIATCRPSNKDLQVSTAVSHGLPAVLR
jgi:hypothetical protein